MEPSLNNDGNIHTYTKTNIIFTIRKTVTININNDNYDNNMSHYFGKIASKDV